MRMFLSYHVVELCMRCKSKYTTLNLQGTSFSIRGHAYAHCTQKMVWKMSGHKHTVDQGRSRHLKVIGTGLLNIFKCQWWEVTLFGLSHIIFKWRVSKSVLRLLALKY